MKTHSRLPMLILCLLAVLTVQPVVVCAMPADEGDRYEVTVTIYPGEDPSAVARELAVTYRAQLDGSDVSGDGRFIVVASAERARLLSRDPRVTLMQVSGSPATSARPRADEGGVVWSVGPYGYDAAGNIKSIGPAETFVYDRLSRIRSGTAGSTHLEEYTYDSYGNVLSVRTDHGTLLQPCVDAQTNQIDRSGTDCNVSGVYGPSGNMTAFGQSATFVYDPLDVVTESTVNNRRRVYLYNANDERIAAIDVVGGAQAGSEWTLRDPQNKVLRRLNKSGGAWTWREDYIYRDGTLLAAEVDGPDRTLHFHLDHLGTPRLITGSGGAEISRHTYYPFGREADPIPIADTERLKFTGHERDDINLDYMHARYYLPYVGRFLSVDPKSSGRLALPQSWHRYAYAANNPIKYVDSDGREITIAVNRRSERVYDVSVRLTIEVYREKGSVRPRWSEFKSALQGAANILGGTYRNGRDTINVKTTIDAIFTTTGSTDMSRHQVELLEGKGGFTPHLSEFCGNETWMNEGRASSKFFAHEFVHWFGIEDAPDIDPTSTDVSPYFGNLADNQDESATALTYEQWLQMFQLYRDGQLNQGIKR